MISIIGEVAGKIWNYLNENNDTTVATLAKKLNLKKEQVTYAIGWLAREEKIKVYESGSSVKVGIN